jgi:diguanylate cyclase (GGDEF)-like protein
MIPKPHALAKGYQTTLLAKIFVTSFLAIHVPLIAMIGFLVVDPVANRSALISILVAATLLGTSLCFLALWRLLRPLRTLAAAVKDYQNHGTPVQLNSHRQDEVGTLARAVTGMVAHVDALMKDLRRQATTDSLTGLGNRRWLSERVAEEQARIRRQPEPLSIVVFDLDRFKDINDRYGHDVGDKVLMTVGETVRDCLRPYDLAARLGGEEFCLVLPRTGSKEALAIAERLRMGLAESVVSPLLRGRVTASFGVCEGTPTARLHDMLAAADRLLYRAKEEGRNRVVVGALGQSDQGRESHVDPR